VRSQYKIQLGRNIGRCSEERRGTQTMKGDIIMVNLNFFKTYGSFHDFFKGVGRRQKVEEEKKV